MRTSLILVESTLSDAGIVTFTTGDRVSFSGSASSVSGGLTANGTTFTNVGGGSNITFTSTATLSGGTNTFNLTIYVPYTLVPSLAGNTSFDQVEISAGTISSGTLALNLLGTTTTNFSYQFLNGFTVGAGGTIAVGANVPILVESTLSDAGIVTFTTGDQVSFSGSASSVSGSLTANGTTFINDGGSNITFTSTATLTGGTNTFNVPIIVPYTLVPSLAGNTSFDQVEISAGTISSGTLSLNLLGTNTANFSYQFLNGFTVGAGGTIAVGANVPVLVLDASTLSDAGNVTFTTGDQVTLYGFISVSGSLTANGTNFINDGGGTNITFTSTATLSGGTNTFGLPIIVPYTLVPSLAGNTSFDQSRGSPLAPFPADPCQRSTFWAPPPTASPIRFLNGFTVGAWWNDRGRCERPALGGVDAERCRES